MPRRSRTGWGNCFRPTFGGGWANRPAGSRKRIRWKGTPARRSRSSMRPGGRGAVLDLHGVRLLREQGEEEDVAPVGQVEDGGHRVQAVSYTHLRAHETDSYLVCRL